MVFKHSKYPNAAKAYIQFMMEAEQYDPWLTGCLGYWSHTLRAYDKSAVWKSIRSSRSFATAPKTSSGPATRDRSPQAAGAVAAEYIMVQMCASVASGQATPEEAAREAERRARRYYR